MSVIQGRWSRRQFVGAGLATAGSLLLPSIARAGEAMDRLMSSVTVSFGIANEKPFGYVETDGKLVGAIPEVIRTAVVPSSGLGRRLRQRRRPVDPPRDERGRREQDGAHAEDGARTATARQGLADRGVTSGRGDHAERA